MGTWNITIRGTGAHHNRDHDGDANRMASEFVRALRSAGHTIHDASFSHPIADLVPRGRGGAVVVLAAAGDADEAGWEAAAAAVIG